MDELRYYYRRLFQLLEEEEATISLCLQGELREQYLLLLKKEKDLIAENLQLINIL